MIEATQKKIKSANTDMVLNQKNPKKPQRTVEEKKQSMTDMLRGTCSKKSKRVETNKLIDVKGGGA